MSVTQGTWHTGEQIRDHKLATSIINLHGTDDAVFDSPSGETDLLKRFTDNPSTDVRNEILQERGWLDGPDTRCGEKAARSGSLAGFVVARYGTDDPVFDERDWELLTEWIRKGMPTGEHAQR